MSKLSELKSRSESTKQALQQQKVDRIRSTITDVVNSSAFTLSALNNLGDDGSDEKIQQFAQTVATHVVDTMLNPVTDFIDTCKARGMSDYKIKKAVKAINVVFKLTESQDYVEIQEAVALYLAHNPTLYVDIALLT